MSESFHPRLISFYWSSLDEEEFFNETCDQNFIFIETEIEYFIEKILLIVHSKTFNI